MLLKDFGEVELTSIPKTGTRITPAHQLSDFQFRTYAPIAFRYFRDMFKVDMCEFMVRNSVIGCNHTKIY